MAGPRPPRGRTPPTPWPAPGTPALSWRPTITSRGFRPLRLCCCGLSCAMLHSYIYLEILLCPSCYPCTLKSDTPRVPRPGDLSAQGPPWWPRGSAKAAAAPSRFSPSGGHRTLASCHTAGAEAAWDAPAPPHTRSSWGARVGKQAAVSWVAFDNFSSMVFKIFIDTK